MTKERFVSVTVIVTTVLALVLGVFIGHKVGNAKKVEVTRWCSWMRGGDPSYSGHYPTTIKYDNVVFDCIPRVNPADLGTDNIRITDRLTRYANYHEEETARLRLLSEKLREMMEPPELKEAGAESRSRAALYIKRAEELEQEAAEKEVE